MKARAAVALSCALAALSTPAAAEPPHTRGETALAVMPGNMRSQTDSWMVAPRGTVTLGGQVGFLTTEGDATAVLGRDEVRFTDVVTLGLTATWVPLKGLELFADTTLLPKGPEPVEAEAWQGGSAGARLGIGRKMAAWAAGGYAPFLADAGETVSASVGLERRFSLDETLIVDLKAGAQHLFLLGGGLDTGGLTEVLTGVELIWRAPEAAALWVSTDFWFPVREDAAGRPHDAETRVGFQLGVAMTYIEHWDVFARIDVIDRGDLARPESTLPLLGGGFDQRVLTIGLTRHFEGDRERRNRYR